jgi:hypothetical protein
MTQTPRLAQDYLRWGYGSRLHTSVHKPKLLICYANQQIQLLSR